MKQEKQARYAVVFPGQGSQYVGMGKEMAENFPIAREIFQSAEQITGLPIQQYSFFGTEDDLRETSATQPCLLSSSLASYAVFQEHFAVLPTFICGHSAGKYAALVAAGVLSFRDAIHLIQVRGSLMANQGGGMAALKVTPEEAKELCQISVLPGGTLVLANWNSPEQVVISGDLDSLEAAIFTALDRGIKVVPLAVSGAFHSPLMEKAAVQFADSVRSVQFHNAKIAVMSNATTRVITSGQEWSKLLVNQIVAPVFWEPSIRYLAQQGIEIFVEVGPGQVLSKLIKKIIPSALTLNVENLSSLKLTVATLQQHFGLYHL